MSIFKSIVGNYVSASQVEDALTAWDYNSPMFNMIKRSAEEAGFTISVAWGTSGRGPVNVYKF